ncbi:MAG: hypothetical protein AB7K09_18450 [Planctomycetota bacterium]
MQHDNTLVTRRTAGLIAVGFFILGAIATRLVGGCCWLRGTPDLGGARTFGEVIARLGEPELVRSYGRIVVEDIPPDLRDKWNRSIICGEMVYPCFVIKIDGNGEVAWVVER